MSVMIAKKTLAAIEKALRADQGARFRGLLRDNLNACDDAFRGEEESPFRSHLGGSLIGRDCPRQLWYGFRWTSKSKHIGRTILLFNRGHLEEGRFVSLLQMIGMQVWQVDAKGKQFRLSMFGGHYGSAIDGVGKGCPDLPGEPINLEFKTSNTKNFKIIEKNGCREAKFEHFIQQQQYMGYYKLRYSLYVVVCKETDELYAEIIPFEEHVYEQYKDRAERIIFSSGPPKGISDSPGAWGCKFCDQKEVCHNGQPPERNCRTCRFSVPERDGRWTCANFAIVLTKEMQEWRKAECPAYEVIPGFGQ